LDMTTKNGKSFLPKIGVESKNDLLNEEVFTNYFEKVNNA